MAKRFGELLGWSEKPATCKCEHPDHPGPFNPPAIFAHGFAYTIAESNESGPVLFGIAGPLQDVELTPEGLVVANAGIFQIQYTVLAHATDTVISPATFQIMINDEIIVASSNMEAETSKQLMSTQLFSLLEGDIIKLVADLPQGMSYSMASMQVIQVG